MKIKVLVVFFLLLFLSSSGTKRVYAQQSSNRSYQSFVESYRRYQQYIEPFKTAKSQYLSFQSLESQVKLLDAARKMISSEVEAMLNFASFIRIRLVEATSVLNYNENFLFVKLDDEISFLSDAKEKIDGTTSLDELKNLTAELQSHYQTISQFSYEIKLVIETGSAQKIFDNLKVEKEKFQEYLQNEGLNEFNMKAAQNMLISFQKETAEANESLTKAKALLKKSGAESDKEGWQLITIVFNKLSLILDGYKGIVTSLK